MQSGHGMSVARRGVVQRGVAWRGVTQRGAGVVGLEGVTQCACWREDLRSYMMHCSRLPQQYCRRHTPLILQRCHHRTPLQQKCRVVWGDVMWRGVAWRDVAWRGTTTQKHDDDKKDRSERRLRRPKQKNKMEGKRVVVVVRPIHNGPRRAMAYTIHVCMRALHQTLPLANIRGPRARF